MSGNSDVHTTTDIAYSDATITRNITLILAKLNVEKANEQILAKSFQTYLDTHQDNCFP